MAPSSKSVAFRAPAPAVAVMDDPWEVRPCGMLVQKRDENSSGELPRGVGGGAPKPIRVRVKHAGVYLEICISPQATFGELKKMLADRTGVHWEDQKLTYKKRERQSTAFLDAAGVHDRSKVVLTDDASARAKRLLEEQRTRRAEKAAKAIAAVAVEVDKIAPEVAALEAAASGRATRIVTVAETTALTDRLMNELLKLDSVVVADDDGKAKKIAQVRRVQRYVEALDAVRLKGSTVKIAAAAAAAPERESEPELRNNRELLQLVVVEPEPTDWEVFDLLSSIPSTSSSMSTATVTSQGPPVTAEWELLI